MGYGSTYHSYRAFLKKNGTGNEQTILFKEGDRFYLYLGKPKSVCLVRWFDGSYIPMESLTDWDLAELKKADGSVEFQGKGSSLPISLSSYVDCWERLRLGLGGTLFINKLEKLNPEQQYAYLGPYIPSQKQHYCLRPFVVLGYKFIENSVLSMLLDTKMGVDFLYAPEDGRFTEISNLGAYSLGLTVEGHISAYFRLFGRASYEHSSGLLGLPSGKLILTQKDSIGISSDRICMLFQLGISLNYPEVPRCKLPGCKTERRHQHAGKVYRGASIFKSRDAQGRRF